MFVGLNHFWNLSKRKCAPQKAQFIFRFLSFWIMLYANCQLFQDLYVHFVRKKWKRTFDGDWWVVQKPRRLHQTSNLCIDSALCKLVDPISTQLNKRTILRRWILKLPLTSHHNLKLTTKEELLLGELPVASQPQSLARKSELRCSVGKQDKGSANGAGQRMEWQSP